MSYDSLQDIVPSLRLSQPTHHHPQNYHQQRHYGIILPPTISTSSAMARYEQAADADSYYYPSYNPPNKPGTGTHPPVYGPPVATPFPEQSVTIELGFDRLILRCVVQEPLEHIVWTRYPCPNDYLFGTNGVPVADGSVVQNADLYDVRIVGENGEIASELLLKSPLEATTSGLYLCEAWPHYQKPSDLYGHYQPPIYASLSDAFIIGGSELLDQCYNNRPPFINRPFNSNRKHYDEESNNNKKLPQQNKNQSNKKPNQNIAADPIRKPRNITTYFVMDKEKIFPDFDSKQKTILYQQPRYNFRFHNYTNINNATLADVMLYIIYTVSYEEKAKQPKIKIARFCEKSSV
ncbi:uncharacterized protein LOC142325694 [Lycorma delicatula]|uniref:uncharacterized protein LOC142325694 n=1 Tax=Lycorma delicatula TaxID=130591 RepID=UPI003F51149F